MRKVAIPNTSEKLKHLKFEEPSENALKMKTQITSWPINCIISWMVVSVLQLQFSPWVHIEWNSFKSNIMSHLSGVSIKVPFQPLRLFFILFLLEPPELWLNSNSCLFCFRGIHVDVKVLWNIFLGGIWRWTRFVLILILKCSYFNYFMNYFRWDVFFSFSLCTSNMVWQDVHDSSSKLDREINCTFYRNFHEHLHYLNLH